MSISQKVCSFMSEASFIRKMFEEGERLRSIHGADKVYDFSLGNPMEEPPAEFIAELKKFAQNPPPGSHRYMSNAGYEQTRKSVAGVLTDDSGLPFGPEHVIMTCGAGGALNIALKALLNPGEEVIVFKPYFVEYFFYIDNHGGVIRELPTGTDFLPDLEALRQAVGPNTKAIILNSPNNPTGVVYPAGLLDAIQRVLAEKEATLGTTVYVISDEPYARLVYDGTEVPCVFKHIKNSIVATSHSKDLALPGERIGYLAVSPDAENVSLMIQALIFCNRTLGYVNAPALMQRLVAPLERLKIDVTPYLEKRNILCEHLTSLGFELVKPMGAFYLFPRSPLPDDVEFIRRAQAHNILLVPGTGFKQPGYFRLSYSVSKKMVLDSLPTFTALARELSMI